MPLNYKEAVLLASLINYLAPPMIYNGRLCLILDYLADHCVIFDENDQGLHCALPFFFSWTSYVNVDASFLFLGIETYYVDQAECQ